MPGYSAASASIVSRGVRAVRRMSSGPAPGRQHGGEALGDGGDKLRLDLGERRPDSPPHRLVDRHALGKRAHQRLQGRLAARHHQVVDQQRRFVVRERDGLARHEAAIEIGQRDDLAALERVGKAQLHLATPLGTRALLLEHRDALGEPARDAVVRHLQRDDVRHLVPQRGLPVEGARRPRPRRVERHHASEAGAERSDHARQADVAHGEVVVLGKDLDQDAAVDGVPVPRGQRVERLARQRQRVLAQDRRLVGMQPQRHHAVVGGLEPLEVVEQPEQVVGDDVVRIGTKRRVERDARAWLVAGAQQVHAEVGRRADVAGFDLERLARQAGRRVEAVVPRGLRAGEPVDVAVARVDGQHGADQRVEVRGPVVEQRDGRLARQRLEARRIDAEGLLDRRAGFVAMVLVERQVGQHEIGRHQRRVEAQRAGNQFASGRAAFVRKGARQAGKGGRVAAVALQRGAERPHRLGAILLVEEQLAPRDLERRRRRRSAPPHRGRGCWPARSGRADRRRGRRGQAPRRHRNARPQPPPARAGAAPRPCVLAASAVARVRAARRQAATA